MSSTLRYPVNLLKGASPQSFPGSVKFARWSPGGGNRPATGIGVPARVTVAMKLSWFAPEIAAQ